MTPKGHTITITPDTRRVRVSIGELVLAESTHTRALEETGLPTRWYFPQSDVRMDLLESTTFSSQCPFKGTAQYWSVQVDGQLEHNIAWSYPTPIAGSEAITGLI